MDLPIHFPFLGQRPFIIMIAGPNGAGKSTFHRAHLESQGLPFINADWISANLGIDSYAAADIADKTRRRLVEERESFVFETVFSDPVGEKINFLLDAEKVGYTVMLIFIGIPNANVSAARVGMRVSKGGHDVPVDKLKSRFPRTLANLAASIKMVDHVVVYDNSELSDPYRQVLICKKGNIVWKAKRLPTWLRSVLQAKK